MNEKARAEGALTALTSARDAAVALDTDPGNDPYLWGYGGRKIVEALEEQVIRAQQNLKRFEDRKGPKS